MVKLPQYEQRIDPDTQTVPAFPSRVGAPGVVINAMNKTDDAIQRAAGVAGDIGQKLFAHAQKINTLQLKKKNAELDTQFRQEMQDKLYSPENETIDVNGVEVSRPKGIYNRSLKQAEGSTKEFDDYYSTKRSEYLSQVSDPDAQMVLASALDNQYLSHRDNVISNEAKQRRADLVNGFKANIMQQIDDAATARDPYTLTEAVNQAWQTQKTLNEALGLDEATAKLAEQKTIYDVIESSTSSALQDDMSGATSLKLLEIAKPIPGDKNPILGEKEYNELAGGIKTKSKKLIDDTKTNLKLARHINSTKILMDVADGNFTMFNVKDLNRMANAGEISNEAATAAIRAIEKPIADYDIKPDDEAFMERVKGIFEASNPADMEKNLIDILDGFSSGSLSQEKMTLLFQAAKGQGSEKATAYRENFKKIYDWGVDAGVPVTYQSQVAKDYVEGINAGKDPVEAAEVAIKRASASQNEGVGADNLRVSENPKENIGFSDRVMTSPVMNTLFEGLSKFSQNRAVKAIGLGQAGMVEGVGGAAKLVGLKDFGEAVSKEAKLMQKTFEIKDPKFLDKLGMGASSSLSFFVPGLAVAKGVTMLRAAPIIATALGVSTSSVLESSIEAGNNFEEAKRRGLNDEQAKQVGGVTFWLNMPLLVSTNVLGGLFNPEGQAVKQAGKKMTVDRIIKAVAEKGVKPAVAEGTQEGLQQVAQNVAIGDPAGQDVRDSAIIGAIVGGGLGAVTNIPSGEKQAVSDAPKDNTVKDSTGKPLEINTEADKISQEIAVKKAVVSQAVAGVETIENGGNSKEVALNSRLAGNLEIINGFNNADVKIEAAKDIDRALFEYFMQDGKSKEEAAVMAQNISQQATQELMKTQNSENFRKALVKLLQENIPTWRLSAPGSLSVSENISETIKEGEKIVKQGGINGKDLPAEDLNIIDQSVTDAKKLVQGGDLHGKSQEGQNGQEKDVLIPQGADTSAPATPLHAEALKYETAEEFVKEQTNIFHGSEYKFSPESIKPSKGTNGTGIYLSLDRNIATKYARGGEVIEYAGKDLKLADTSKFTKEQSEQFSNAYEKTVKQLGEHSDEATNQAYKSMGFDGKKITDTEIMLFDNSKIKTKSQLTAIWNEAHGVGATAVKTDTAVPGETPASQPIKRVMPTGKKKESAAYQRALERYSEELKNQPEATYTTIGIADQMARAVKFVDENPKLAKKIAYGIEPAPAGLRESAVSIAYNEKMYQDGNMSEFGKSYRSRSLRQTSRGQEIVLERAAEVNLNHPLHFARMVIEARTAQIGKKLYELTTKDKPDAPAKRAYKEINEKASRLKKEIVDTKTLDITEAQKIIDSLIC